MERSPSDSPPSLLSVVIPVYNERNTIEEILLRVQAVEIDKELIIVDDGSTDGTREFLRDLSRSSVLNPTVMVLPGTQRHLETGNITVLLQERNRGKGAALRRGFQEARGAVVIIQDADLEYDPGDYPGLLDPIMRGTADVVYGTRFRNGIAHGTPPGQYLGNRALTALSSAFTRLKLSDVYVGYKVFRRTVLDAIELHEDRFGFEPEVTAKIARARWRVQEIPITYHPRTRLEGKKLTWKDAVAGVWCILRYS